MKSLLFAITMIIATGAMAQKANPAVESAFAKAFPGISVKSWDNENGKFEANFTKDGKQMSATFDANGGLEETEMDVAVNELPASITSYVQDHYKGEEIKEAAMITKPNGEKMYEAEVKEMDLVFDAKGNFVKEEMEMKDKEDKD